MLCAIDWAVAKVSRPSEAKRNIEEEGEVFVAVVVVVVVGGVGMTMNGVW